ncbi:formylmethionine deformylase-like protein [Diplodia corticola]|uniref:Formylmethionine deformylase-like protein n=1 Tax=Diplodia corticola TaxID=236234 RepID=A0A1J9R8D5_9PEZI|nr:formylmethionine deformylase-like protein [Diplodia corticola]OJD36450.1 formylmethionine deformylase-like protein [Diplodia corticola]
MSFTSTSLFDTTPMRGLSGMLYKWLPKDDTSNAPAVPAASVASTPRTTLGKRKRDAPTQPRQTPVQPNPAPAEPRSYGMRNRPAKSYAEIDSDDELIDESDPGSDSDSDYDTAPRKKPQKPKTKPLPKHLIFPFMRLPRELRDMIYAHALTDPIGALYIEERFHRYRRKAARVDAGPQSYLANYSHWTEQNPAQAMARWPIAEGYYAPNAKRPKPHRATLSPSLLAVSRRINAEATSVLYSQPLVFADAGALHAFLAPLPVAPAREALRDVTVLGVRGSWERSMRAAFDVAALTLLAEGATNLNVLRYHDEGFRDEPSADEGPRRAARRFYRRALHWLDVVARERGVDEAVGVVQVICLNNEVWGRDDPDVMIGEYWDELKRPPAPAQNRAVVDAATMGSLHPNHELEGLASQSRQQSATPCHDNSAPEISRSSSPVSGWFGRGHAQPQDDPPSFHESTNALNPATKSHFIEDATQLQPTDSRTSRTASWRIHWRSPTLMMFFLIAGIAFALGHHFHYQSLDGTTVSTETSQQWAIRIGTGLAFLCKTSLAASVGVAYTQRLWVTVKKRVLSLQNLDDAFSLTTDPFSFFSSRVLISAKLLCLLAACMWCIPIVATITPATLSVRAGLSNDTSSMRVPRPSYGNEIWGITWVNFEGVGRIESPSAAVNRLIATTSSSIAILPFTAPSPNSSYTLDFYAPAIKCETLSAAISNNTIKLDDPTTLEKAWNESMYSDMKKSSTFEQLYIGKTMSVLDTYYIPNHFFINTNGASGRNYSCHMWNASYTVDFVSLSGTLSSTITDLSPVSPLAINGSGVATADYAPGEIAYWSLYSALSDIIVTSVYYGSTCSLNGADTSIFKSGIPACPEIMNDTVGGCSGSGASSGFQSILSPWMCRGGSVPRAVEDLSHNVSLSLMSSALFSNATDAAVTVSLPQNYYAYNRRNLLCAYLAAVVAALACVAVGAHAYGVNGYSASQSFSSVLFTTRNPDLDALARGQCLGEQPTPGEVKGTMLRYGVLRSGGGGVPHVAFGLRDTVGPLKKGELCS